MRTAPASRFPGSPGPSRDQDPWIWKSPGQFVTPSRPVIRAAASIGGLPAQHLSWRGICALSLGTLISGPAEVASTALVSARPPTRGNRRSEDMNKRDLIDAISGRIGDKKTATEAVNPFLDTIPNPLARRDKAPLNASPLFENQGRPPPPSRNAPPRAPRPP